MLKQYKDHCPVCPSTVSYHRSDIFILYFKIRGAKSQTSLNLVLLLHKKCRMKGKSQLRCVHIWSTLVTRIKEVLRIKVMGVKLFHVMVPLEDMVDFIYDIFYIYIRIRALVCQV